MPGGQDEGRNIGGFGVEERRRGVKLARMEIQGAWEFFKKVKGFEDMRDLDRASTGVFEKMRDKDWECEYCEKKHRNGDCKLPWGPEK